MNIRPRAEDNTLNTQPSPDHRSIPPVHEGQSTEGVSGSNLCPLITKVLQLCLQPSGIQQYQLRQQELLPSAAVDLV